MRRHIWKLALVFAVVSTAAFAFYAAHNPTPAEQKAITRYVDTMNKVLDQFRSPDWDEKVDSTIDHPMVGTFGDRPMDIDQMLQRTYEVRKDSKRYQTLVLPRLQKVATEKDLSTKQLEAARIEDLQHLQVQVHFNMLVVPMITGPDLKVDTKVPGATFVHKDRNNPFSHGVAYVLFFSNGKAGRWEEVNDVYRNFFVHKPDTPFIENIEVRIFGPEDRIKELLHKIDWKQVNSALTL
ncbi:MAG TPA: hypothetical protein VGQ12_12115 [Candidatus Angelobacter sp.]|jgi:hypothetical protein|nr:hypothetical protein [Candidatus Angelobacter sp.]